MFCLKIDTLVCKVMEVFIISLTSYFFSNNLILNDARGTKNFIIRAFKNGFVNI